MPKRNNIKKLMIIGSGPIKVGQGCEFDYAGAQASKTLLNEGIEIVLLNSNPATIMTDPEVASRTYIKAINWESATEIIAKEKPDALLPTMGGQTAINCTIDLINNNILDKYNIELLGSSYESIIKCENRETFNNLIKTLKLEVSKSYIANNIKQALELQKNIGFPTIIRPSFTLGGKGGGIAYNVEEFIDICNRGLESSPNNQILIEESLAGWKEYEMELLCDNKGNAIVVCTIENIDPMGIHTGDSITVAPALTLSDKEYQKMRNAALKIIRAVKLQGGANIQFGINPQNGRMVVIEMNPRVSRSSALASKATGYPIAKIAAKLAIGYQIHELKNDVTGDAIVASFETSQDYIVVKMPRFDELRFIGASKLLTTRMKSVGEGMGIGRNFKEALQKAICSLELNFCGLSSVINQGLDEEHVNIILQYELQNTTNMRLWYIADAIRQRISIDEIYEQTQIDKWFLYQIDEIISIEEYIKTNYDLSSLDFDTLFNLKRQGFSDKRIAELVNSNEKSILLLREKLKIFPSYKRVDSCAGEYPTDTAYLYSTYENECEAEPNHNNKKILVIGSGPNRIGQGIEFDYCCVHAVQAMKELGYETIMINCNPETVSTDYDTADKLYFEPLSFENVLNIINKEKPTGVIIQYGGQTPLNIAKKLLENNVPIIGTSVESIDAAENRNKFSAILHEIGLKQPPSRVVKDSKTGFKLANEIGFPLIARPSYVIGGSYMEVIYNNYELKNYLHKIKDLSDNPLYIDVFLDDAVEVDVDVISDNNEAIIAGIMEHIEQAGIHSGDSVCSLPACNLSKKVITEINRQAKLIARALKVVGLLNIQFAIKDDEIFVLEANPRASRTIPFIAKATGVPIAKIAAKIMAGKKIKDFSKILAKLNIHQYISVKVPKFSFESFHGVDPILGPQMRSTGEVMGQGKDFVTAYHNALLSVGVDIKKLNRNKALISVKDDDKNKIIPLAKKLIDLGFTILATNGTAKKIRSNNLPCISIHKVMEGRPNIVDILSNKDVDLVINTTKDKKAIYDSYNIRQTTQKYNILYTTSIASAFALCKVLEEKIDSNICCLQEDIVDIGV